jgi:hypothetical protein
LFGFPEFCTVVGAETTVTVEHAGMTTSALTHTNDALELARMEVAFLQREVDEHAARTTSGHRTNVRALAAAKQDLAELEAAA